MPGENLKEGEPIPEVDSEDLRRRWNIKPPWTSESLQTARSHEVDSAAVDRRDGMIRMLADFKDRQVLAPWRHGEELNEAVFRVAATFPMRKLRQSVYRIAGDEIFGFDPNAFLQRLIEETGISHVWEPIPTRISEGATLSPSFAQLSKVKHHQISNICQTNAKHGVVLEKCSGMLGASTSISNRLHGATRGGTQRSWACCLATS